VLSAGQVRQIGSQNLPAHHEGTIDAPFEKTILKVMTVVMTVVITTTLMMQFTHVGNTDGSSRLIVRRTIAGEIKS
jgi:hypothetical protein